MLSGIVVLWKEECRRQYFRARTTSMSLITSSRVRSPGSGGFGLRDPGSQVVARESRVSQDAPRSGRTVTTSLDNEQLPARDALLEWDQGIDIDAAEIAARALIGALGLNLNDPDLAGTPGRMVRGLAELLTPRPFTLTTFPNDRDYDEMVVARGIPFTSVCEHHLLPFAGTAAVAYLPGDRIVGLSKLARVVELFARRPQVQERMTVQIADCLERHLRPAGVGVILEADHTCMTLRGVGAKGATTVTSALYGRLRSDSASRAEFLTLGRSATL